MINDFIEYWAATKLLLSGGNPYAPAELLARQKELGWAQPEALMMWNPPWTLSLTLPFGLFDYPTAQLLWFLFHTLILFVGAALLWKIYGGSPQKSRYAGISVLSFAPTYFALLLGQIGPLIVLGLIAFLAALKRESWALAGASLTLALVKPHLLYLVWPALVLWILKKQQWRLAVGFVLTGTIFATLPLVFDRQIYWQYAESLSAGGVTHPLHWATPSLGTTIAELLAIRRAWIRWLPSICGTIWFFWHWSRHAGNWDWLTDLPLLILVSVCTTSFAWTFDYVVMIPALIQAAVWASQSKDRATQAIFVAAHLGLGSLLFASKLFVRDDFWYFWVAPILLVFYLIARATVGAAEKFHNKMVLE
jgi:glycosyl transferase family 87